MCMDQRAWTVLDWRSARASLRQVPSPSSFHSGCAMQTVFYDTRRTPDRQQKPRPRERVSGSNAARLSSVRSPLQPRGPQNPKQSPQRQANTVSLVYALTPCKSVLRNLCNLWLRLLFWRRSGLIKLAFLVVFVLEFLERFAFASRVLLATCTRVSACECEVHFRT